MDVVAEEGISAVGAHGLPQVGLYRGAPNAQALGGPEAAHGLR